MSDIATTAADFVSAVVPYLPTLKSVGDYLGDKAAEATNEVAETAVRRFGEAAWGRLRAIWVKISTRAKTDPVAEAAIEQAAATPDDPDAVASFRLQLRKLLETDAELAGEVAEWVSSARMTIAHAAGNRSVAVGGSVHASAIVTGDRLRIERDPNS